jgi:NodT family efflux transporter outer membrane factor (OMF) lipoprotein
MTPRFLLTSGLVLSLAACNLAPDYRAPLIDVPASYKEIGPWQPARPADAAPRGPWWQQFADPTLDRLEQRLDRANPDLAATVARYDQARAAAVEAEAGLYPQISLGASSIANRQSSQRPLRGDGPNQYTANTLDAQASYEIDLWGNVRNKAAAGRALAQASAADLATVRLSLQAELASDYVTLRGLDADAKLLSDTVAAFQKALDLTRTLLNGKVVPGTDVSRAQAQLEAARAQVSDIAGRRALLEHAIATLEGEPASSFSIAVEQPKIRVPDLPTIVPSTLLQRRPDIAAAERTVKAANAEIGVARAAFYPSVSLNLLGGFQSTGLSAPTLPLSFWSLGPDVSLPLFTGGTLDAEESAAYAKFREASEDYRSTVLGAFQEVEDNLALIHWLGTEETHESAAVTAAQRTLDSAFDLYRQGASSYLEVVTAQTALLQAQQTAIDVQARQLEAEVGLARALGGGWKAADLPSDSAVSELPANG